jgi:hypothetical protein
MIVFRKLFRERRFELFSKQRKQQGQDDTDEDGGNNGKVKSEILFSDEDVSGKSPDPWNFLSDQ